MTIVHPVPDVFAIQCSNSKLSRISLRSSCEMDNGTPVSCFGNPKGIKRSYVRCETGYFNNKNVSVQILECIDGRWSDEIIKCKPQCTKAPDIDDIKLIESNEIDQYPPWYVEIIRKEPIEGEINKFPGIIIHETEILTLEKYINADNIDIENYNKFPLKREQISYRIDYAQTFWIRIYKSKTEFINIEPWDFYCYKAVKSENWKEYCYITTQGPYLNYIKYSDFVKPVCPEKKYPIIKNRQSHRNDKLLNGSKNCIAPRDNNPKFEVLCFKEYKTFMSWGTHVRLLPTDCLEEDHYLLLTRCRLGYEYTKPNEDDFLSKCYKGDWETKNDDCNLICGEIDKDYIPFQTQLIYNGNKTDITLSPWHVAIFGNHTILSDSFEQLCSGTIIHHNIVISAAHCFYDVGNSAVYDPSNYLIGAGKNFRTFEADEKDSFYSEIKEIHIPKNYQSSDTLNDIAILILEKSFKYSAHIKPVCIDFTLYEDYSVKSDILGQINGWGPTSSNGKLSNELRTATLKTLTNEECKKKVHPNHRSQIIGDKFCATNEINSTACQGDSGGGFIIKQDIGQGERYYLTGIISTGIDRTKYCSNGFLTLFTNIQFYQNFIKDIISENRNLNDVQYRFRNRASYCSQRCSGSAQMKMH